MGKKKNIEINKERKNNKIMDKTKTTTQLKSLH